MTKSKMLERTKKSSKILKKRTRGKDGITIFFLSWGTIPENFSSVTTVMTKSVVCVS